MNFDWKILFGKDWKGFVAGLLAQIIPQIPELIEGVPLGDWGAMTIRGAIVALLVMGANLIKHKLIPVDTNKINTLVRKII